MASIFCSVRRSALLDVDADGGEIPLQRLNLSVPRQSSPFKRMSKWSSRQISSLSLVIAGNAASTKPTLRTIYSRFASGMTRVTPLWAPHRKPRRRSENRTGSWPAATG
jgi:hypothetical protein